LRYCGGSATAERWLGLEELADVWGVPYDVLLDLAREGEIPSRRVGRHRLYPIDAVAVYVEKKGLAIDEYSD
jgi:excisionase family DNA binding protein